MEEQSLNETLRALAREGSRRYRAVVVLLVLPLLLPALYAVGNLLLRLTGIDTPFQLFFPIFHKTLLFQLLVEAAVIAYAALLARERTHALSITIPLAFLSALGGILTLSALLSGDPNASFFGSTRRGDGVFFLLHLILSVAILGDVIRTRRQLEGIFAFAIAGGFATIAIVAVTIFSTRPLHLFTRAGWLPLTMESLGNPNFVAHYFLLLFLLCGYFILRERRGGRLLIAATFLSVIILTSSNLAIILAVAATFALLATYTRWVPYGILLIGLSAAVILARTGDAILVRAQSFIDSAHIRLLIWKDSLLAVLSDHPWLGYGWGNAEFLWNRAPVDSPAQFYTPSSHFFADRMHNILLETLGAAGVIGLSVALALGGYLIWRSARMFRARQSTSDLFFLLFFATQFSYLLFNFDTLMSYVLSGIVLAGFLALDEHRRYDVAVPNALRRVLFPVVGILSVALMLTTSIAPFRASFLKTRADFAIARADAYVTPRTADIIAELDRALDIPHPYRTLQRDIATSFYALTDTGTLSPEERSHVYRTLTAMYQDILAHAPMSASAHHNLALLETKFANNLTTAAAHLEDAVRIAPSNGLLRYQLGLLYFQSDARAAARRTFQELRNDGVYTGPVMLYLGFLNFRDGNVREGKKNVITALTAYQPNEREWNNLIASFLTHTNARVLLAWYPTLRRMSGGSPSLDDAMERVARELDRAPAGR